MRKKIIMDEGRWLLEAIAEEYEAISGHAGKIPAIEIDILKENVRKLYENLRILQRLEDPHITDEHVPKPGITAASAETPSEPEVRKMPPADPEEPVRQPESSPELQKPPQPPRSSPVRRVVKSQETDAMVDLFGQQEDSHTMKLQDSRERSFAPKIPGARIENLKMAIPINDKFMFINDLFDGNLREYNETIEALNGFKTIEQAAEYLDLMRRKNFWNTGSTAFLKLKELVERRF